jgi:hypothetical protein
VDCYRAPDDATGEVVLAHIVCRLPSNWTGHRSNQSTLLAAPRIDPIPLFPFSPSLYSAFSAVKNAGRFRAQ